MNKYFVSYVVDRGAISSVGNTGIGLDTNVVTEEDIKQIEAHIALTKEAPCDRVTVLYWKRFEE
jgi:hypothetical protein